MKTFFYMGLNRENKGGVSWSDVRSWTLAQPWEPIMYQTSSQVPDHALTVVNRQWPSVFIVRTLPGVTPMSVSGAVLQVLFSHERLAVSEVRTMEQVSLDSTASQQFTSLLMGIFAGTAV